MMLTLLKNLARSLAVLLVVTFATFTLMFGNGDGIARAVLGLNARPEDVQREVVTLGLDQPLLVQYWHWLRDAVTGDLGESFYTGQSVTEALSSRVPVTLALVIITLLLAVVLSVLLGVTAAVKGGWVDRLLQFVTVLGTAIPSFIIAIVLVFTFAIAWRVLPATGYVTPEISVSGWAKSVTLPVLALLVGAVASAAAQFRTAVLDTLGRDYIRTLRARGISERHVIFRHVLRNSAGPGLTVLSLTTLGLLGGAVFVEQVFALPGMGQLANQSAQVNDVPMVMGTVLVTIVIVLVVNFLGDLATTVLNPKARIR
ncbi:binding-protein-dependent transport systems inner membrane component [Parafrankia sp. EAN1pec]|uniref:ABC transporter permease n=1 Tax=Parafrankia sp. (strain EAN1pec) TaxID=298653 RepID=UPI0000541187|nr:binding-protein-dependent transport systems inner membrane component [Frankia sp. EAN1pec]